MLRWIFCTYLVLTSSIARAEISLQDALHGGDLGAVADPSRQSVPIGTGGSYLGNTNDVCGAFRPSSGTAYPAAGGSTAPAASAAPASDPALAQGGTFNLAQVKQSLMGRCAKCHTGSGPGVGKLLLNDAAFSDLSKMSAMRAAITSGKMPQGNPGFKDTPEGKAVVKFLETVR